MYKSVLTSRVYYDFILFFSVILLDSTKHPRLNWTTYKDGQTDSQNYGVSFFGEIELA